MRPPPTAPRQTPTASQRPSRPGLAAAVGATIVALAGTLCIATDTNVVLITGSREYPRWVHTLEPRTGTVTSSHRLGKRLNPYAIQALPDGTLVAGTDRRGIYVGTDPTNTTLEFRPANIDPDRGTVAVVSNDLIATFHGDRHVQVSTDKGATWAIVNPRFARP